MLGDTEAARHVSGIGVHWYWDWFVPAKILTDTHNLFPEYFILYTEACTGAAITDINKVALGSWERGEAYAVNILQGLLNWIVRWVDWNIVLNEKGGPNWADNHVDAPIIVNATGDEFYKQPMFYILGHFSKFLPRDSFRVSLDNVHTSHDDVIIAAFETPEKHVVVEILNRNDFPVTVEIEGEDVPNRLVHQLPPDSMTTLLWKLHDS